LRDHVLPSSPYPQLEWKKRTAAAAAVVNPPSSFSAGFHPSYSCESQPYCPPSSFELHPHRPPACSPSYGPQRGRLVAETSLQRRQRLKKEKKTESQRGKLRKQRKPPRAANRNQNCFKNNKIKKASEQLSQAPPNERGRTVTNAKSHAHKTRETKKKREEKHRRWARPKP